MSGAGCQSSETRPRTPACPLIPGMTVDQLVSCGCFTLSNNINYAGSLSQGDLRQQGQSVTIQNYLCPRGSAGFIKVVVINGIANEIFE